MLWDVRLRSPVTADVSEEHISLHIQGRYFSEAAVYFHQTIRHYIPYDRTVRSRRFENLRFSTANSLAITLLSAHSVLKPLKNLDADRSLAYSFLSGRCFVGDMDHNRRTDDGPRS
jgi:hypothetical protein